MNMLQTRIRTQGGLERKIRNLMGSVIFAWYYYMNIDQFTIVKPTHSDSVERLENFGFGFFLSFIWFGAQWKPWARQKRKLLRVGVGTARALLFGYWWALPLVPCICSLLWYGPPWFIRRTTSGPYLDFKRM